jgi:PKD repeat protein
MRKSVVLLTVVLGCGLALPAQAEWFKGNTHCHSEVSSDSSTPQEELFGWYKTNGYHFVVMTDHNRYTEASVLNGLRYRGENLVDDGFVLIAGEELTNGSQHINGIDIPRRLEPAPSISGSFERIWAAGGLPQLNHPEYNYIEAREITEEIAELDGSMFLEVYNSHPIVIRRSGPSSEDIWDDVLSAGRKMWGVAVDDAHTLPGGETPPGGGYIWVDAEELTVEAIVDAMDRGRFYASSGAVIDDFQYTSSYYEVDAPGADRIVFIGQNGRVLAEIEGAYGSYDIAGDERYVRARVESRAGVAWTQPVYLTDLPDNRAPVAEIEVDKTSGEAPLFVTLDGRASSDPDGEVVTWRWDFGDGSEGRGEIIAHEFTEPGEYTVELTVFDDTGEPSRATQRIRVVEAGANNGANNGGNNGANNGANNGGNNGANNNGNNGANNGGSDVGVGDDTGGVPPPPPPATSRSAKSDEGCATAPLGSTPSMWQLLIRR